MTDASDDALAAWRSLIDSLLQDEESRKNSLEVRSLALITVDLTTTTLYVAASARSNFILSLSDGRTSWLISAALISILVSLLSALFASLPYAYGNFDLAGLNSLKSLVAGDPAKVLEMKDKISAVRLRQLRNARRNNGVKVAFLLLSACAVVTAVALFLYAIHLR